tara:strand:- start:331 stop:897 length:567 start_codon:yes stop_codon:yes gene_type:complete
MKRTTTGSCHAAARGASIGNAAYQIALVGNPNVGKSVVFNRLIGGTTTVSNYPGTTVEVFRGRFDTGTGIPMEVIDTPGMYTFSCITEEEGVTRRLLFQERPDIVVHVIEAKALARSLPLTAQLVETGFDVIVAINMMDELARAGLVIDTERLADRIRLPVIPLTAIRGDGIAALVTRIEERAHGLLN